MKPTKRKAFNFLRSYFDVLNELDNDSDKLNFLLSIINKQFINEDPKDLNFITNLCYESQRHQIESSVKGWERASKETLGTTPSTTPSTTPKEEEEEEEKGEEEEEEEYTGGKPPKFSFKKSLIDLGVEENIVSDWLKVRSKKRAANTETAFKSLKTQIEKSGLPANECIKISVENSWAGFKPEWLKNIDSNNLFNGQHQENSQQPKLSKTQDAAIGLAKRVAKMHFEETGESIPYQEFINGGN